MDKASDVSALAAETRACSTLLVSGERPAVVSADVEVNTDVSLPAHLNLRQRSLELEGSFFGSQKMRVETMLRQSFTLVYQHGPSLKAFSII